MKWWRCSQTNANQSPLCQRHCPLCGAEAAPLVESGGSVIPPFEVLRRLGCILQATKPVVLEITASLSEVYIRREMTRESWSLWFADPEATGPLREETTDYVEPIFGRK